MSAILKLPFDLTVAEFFEWCPDDGQRWQLVDGEPVAMAPTRQGHNLLLLELGARLRQHLLDAGSPCRVMPTPGIVPMVGAASNFRIPDLGVTCAPVSPNEVMVRDPVLLVEILSPGNARQTRANVWAYITIPSVREILLLHGSKPRAELYRRDRDGAWPAEPIIVTDGTLTLDSVGCAVDLGALYSAAGLFT